MSRLSGRDMGTIQKALNVFYLDSFKLPTEHDLVDKIPLLLTFRFFNSI